MTNDVLIYEPVYRAGQLISEPAAVALNWLENPLPEWREFAIYIAIYRQNLFSQSRLTGLFSPKFSLKSQISFSQFVAFASQQTDADVCFLNPFPQIPYYSYNVWMQGETAHPGLIRTANDLLAASGIGWRVEEVLRQKPTVVGYSSFWVGNANFWNRYVGQILLPVTNFIINNPDHQAVKAVMKTTVHTDAAPYLPFVLERLFSTFLSLTPDIKFSSWRHDRPAIEKLCVNQYEKILFQGMIERVNLADAQSDFPEHLRKEMAFLCELSQQQFFDYFSLRPHPHTSKTVDYESFAGY